MKKLLPGMAAPKTPVSTDPKSVQNMKNHWVLANK